jgi:2-amino-4-hydroxy-6-hydroxymethyldihydropteridine diphosphokinase
MGRLDRSIAPGWGWIRTEGFPLDRPLRRRRGEQELWLGIGGNLGDVPRRFQRLIHCLDRQPDLRLAESSPILLNPPFGYLEQPEFCNAVLRLYTRLTPRQVLRRMLEIERRFGRRRLFKDGPRTLDIDLLFYEDRRIRTPELTLPHPRWRERLSVTMPLARMRRLPPGIRRDTLRRQGP